VLLLCSVALCATLVVAVACAMASLTAAIAQRIKSTVGGADVKVRHVGSASFDSAIVDLVRAWPQVQLVAPRAQETVTLDLPSSGTPSRETVIVIGIEPIAESAVRDLVLAKDVAGKPRGRLPTALGEVTIDTIVAKKLGANVGDVLQARLFAGDVPLSVVGIVDQPPLGAIFERMEVFATVAQVSALADKAGRINEIDLVLAPGSDSVAFVERHKADLPPGMMLQSTARITSGLDKNLQSQQVGFLLASVLAFLTSSFIITTGLTTAVGERARELAIVRCIGGSKGQLGLSQVFVGACIGGLGGLIGTPVGIGLSYVIVTLLPEQLPGGFALSWLGVILSLLGSLLAGIVGALFPAYLAARVNPREGLTIRARTPRASTILLMLAAAIILIGSAMLIAGLISGDLLFWLYVFIGVPALLCGWFLLAPPTLVVVNAIVSPVLGRVLGLPPQLLRRSVGLTPFRHGFTAGAMMLGLSIMVSLWTNGGSILRDWLVALQIPDGFVQGLNMKEATRQRVAAVPGVAATCAITIQSVETDAFGVRGVSTYKTSFVAFEPATFFGMTKITWVAPTAPAQQQEAIAELTRGGSIIIAREFQVAKGIGVGDFVTLKHNGQGHQFKVVGVVTSPGLDIVSKFYDVGEGYIDQALSSVFGSRSDLISLFGNDAINLIQIQLKPDADGPKVMNDIKSLRGGGILSAGSAIEIKERIIGFISGSLLVASGVAVGAMIIACFAVANLVVAGVQTRRFEFGVLRAIGGQRSLLSRLVLGEALIIGIAACLLGTGMGLHAAWGGQQMYRSVIGLLLTLQPPWMAIGFGCLAVIVITAVAAVPSAISLLGKQPRELLFSMKG